MAKSAFDGIKAALTEAAAHARGEPTGCIEHHVEADAIDVKAARKKLGLSQPKFAAMLGVPVSTARKWEQGQRRPTGAARTLLKVIEREPDAVRRVIGGA